VNDSNLQSTLLGWIIPLTIGISVLLRSDKDLRQKLFVLFAGNVSLYYLFSFLYVWRGEPWFERIALAIAIFIPQGGLRFFRAFSMGARGMGRLGGIAAILGLILLGAVLYPWALRPAVGPAVLAYVAGFMLVAILNLNVQAKAAATRVDEARIRYLVVGGLLTVGFQIIDRFDHIFQMDLPPIGLVMTMIYLYVISQTIIRYRILDLYEMLGRFAVLFLMGIALSGIYTALVFWAGKGFTVNAFLASLIILILLNPLRDLVKSKIADFFFRERQLLEQDVSMLRRRLVHVIDSDIMGDVLIDGFTSSKRITHAALYLIDAHGHGFGLQGGVGETPYLERVETAVARRHLEPLWSSGAVVTANLEQRRERLLQEGDREEALSIGETLELLGNMRADVLLPIRAEDDLLGLIALGDERLNDPFSPEDVVLLRGLAGQVAITVENSRLYQQTKERDRLAVLGQMAAGLAHEIRNPLGSIKGAAQVIEEVEASAGNTGPESELLGVIVEEVDRLNRVVSDFLDYARPSSGRPQLLDVNQIVRRTLQLLESGQEQQVSQVDFVVDLAVDLPQSRMDGERLHQIVLNLVINAAQAMKGLRTRRLEISTRVRKVRRLDSLGPARSVRYVELRLADSGPGLSPETMEKIFIPFFTTKQKGSGLGLAVCQRMVRDAGGEIEVRSQIGEGSIFTVVLPAEEPESEMTPNNINPVTNRS
jgi:two-component system, NtrC family, sensor histidine kinase HydH